MSDAARFRGYCGRQSGRRAGHSLHDCDRARRKGHRVCLFTTVEDPDELRSVLRGINDRLVSPHQQLALEQRQHRVREARERWRVVTGSATRPIRTSQGPALASLSRSLASRFPLLF